MWEKTTTASNTERIVPVLMSDPELLGSTLLRCLKLEQLIFTLRKIGLNLSKASRLNVLVKPPN